MFVSRVNVTKMAEVRGLLILFAKAFLVCNVIDLYRTGGLLDVIVLNRKRFSLLGVS